VVVGEALEVVHLRMDGDAVAKVWAKYGRWIPIQTLKLIP
jgi:hypothetical protein